MELIFRENLNPEDLATQSVRLKEEQLRREEGRLKEIEVNSQFYSSNCAVESAKRNFRSQTRTSCKRRSTQISRSKTCYKSNFESYWEHPMVHLPLQVHEHSSKKWSCLFDNFFNILLSPEFVCLVCRDKGEDS